MDKESQRTHWEEVGYDIDTLCTCNDCLDKGECPFAFDLYNHMVIVWG